MTATLSAASFQSQIEKTIVQSLVTSFGLDFLLFKDQHGGDVNTIHNARQGVYATQAERQRYKDKGDYHGAPYHQHANYINRGAADKQRHAEGTLFDANRNQHFAAHEKRNLDHVIAAHEIHHDAGRVLAEIDGVDIANRSSNFQSTQESINKSKKEKSVTDYLHHLDQHVAAEKTRLDKLNAKIASAPTGTPQERHQQQKDIDKAAKLAHKIEQLESIDKDSMRERDRQARAAYEREINLTYYTSSKFLQSTGIAAGQAGLKLGTRQMLGLVLAEVWFELREGLPKLYQALRQDFCFATFWREVRSMFSGISERVRSRFHDFLIAFKDGAFAGVLSSLTTTVLNIFATTGKNAIKMIREVWVHLVSAFKIYVFNPDRLSSAEMGQAICMTLSTAASALVGTWVYGQLVPVLNFPFGNECAVFLSALTSGLMTIGLGYFFLHSPLMQKLWHFQDRCDHSLTLRQYQTVNAQLDAYLLELSRLELNLDAQALQDFAGQLTQQHTELERAHVLQAEIARRNIDLPFAMGNTESTRQWLTALAKQP